jgi:hypothetical protein
VVCMRKALYIAALLSTTALYPTQALAMPPVVAGIAAFAGGAASAFGIGTGVAAIGLSSGAALAGFQAAAFLTTGLGGLLANAALGIGLNYLAAALTPQPQSPPPTQRFTNLRQPVQDRTKAYGLTRIGGPVFFWQAIAPKRYYGVIVNTGEIDAIQSRWLDEREATLDGSGFVTNTEYQSGGRSRVQLQEFLGATGQTAPSFLFDNFTDWTSDHKMTGLAGAVIVAENSAAEDFSSVYPSGREPVYTALVRGTKCYDPRTETTAWTKNAALILADWITSADGLGREVDWSLVSTEADICDQDVTNRNGDTIKRWELCGAYNFSETREGVRAAMGVACDAFFYETSDGKVGFKVGRYEVPTVTLTGDHITSLRLIDGSEGPGTVNAYAVQYTEPDIGYREQECAPIIIDDGQPYEQATIQSFWTPNHNQASRIAKRLLRQQRAQFRLSASLNLHGLRLIGERFFYLSYPDLGIENQAFEIGKLSYSDDGLSIEVEATSCTSADFDFVAADEESAPPISSTISDSVTTAPPTNVSAVSLSITGGTAISVSWDAPGDTILNQVRYRTSDAGSGAGDWFQFQVSQGQAYAVTPALSDGVSYDIQVRAQRQSGQTSVWTPVTPISVVAVVDASAPDVVTGVSAVGGSGIVDFEWTAPNNANYVASRIYRNTANTFAGSTLVRTEYGAASTVDTWQDTGLAADDYYYWIVAINGSGIEATEVATGSVNVT